MERQPVESSVIAEVGYNPSLRTLEILFKSGAIYLYYFVPQETYQGLIDAESKGSYFNKQIKGKFDDHQIADPYDAPKKKKTTKKSGQPGKTAQAPRELPRGRA